MRLAWAPWIALATLSAVAWAYAGWSQWLARFLHLTVAFALAHASYSIVARRRPAAAMPLAMATAIACAVGSAAIASMLLRALSGAASLPVENFGFDFGLAAAFASTLLVPRLMHHDRERRLVRDKHLAELRLKALEGQIEPHFLYNTLANVQQLVRSTPQEADRMLEALIRYLKAVIPDVRNGRSSLGHEVERTEAYLAIMHMRMGERLQYRIDVPADIRSVAVPPLGVVTLVENAVKHGLEPKPAGGSVVVEARRESGRVQVSVTDDGAGFGEDVGTGTGLQNLRERIETLYGANASLDLEHAQPCGVRATLTVPAA